MAVDAGSIAHALRGGTPSRLIAGGWAVAAVCVLAQGVAQQAVGGGTVSGEFLLRWRLLPIALWGAVAPPVLVASRRWPPTRGRWPVRVAAHGLAFAVWMFVSNLLLRLPDLAGGAAAPVVWEAVAAAVEYAPAGALAWALLIGLERAHEAATDTRRLDEAPGEPVQLKVGHRTYLVPPDAILWVEARGDYVRVHTEERVLRVRETMKALHARIGRGRFVRIHRSTLVNVRFVREVQPYFHGDHVAILRDGTELRIPRSRKDALRRLRGSRETS